MSWSDTGSLPDRPWLTVAEAAAALAVSTRVLYNAIADGRVSAYRFGRVYRISRRDLQEIILQSRVSEGDD